MESNELIKRVKTNDDNAYSQLLEDYKNMIYYIINTYQLECGDYLISKDDLFQEASIALYDACKAYKEDNKAKFSTFAYMVIKRRLSHCYKVSKNKYINEYVSIDAYENNDRHKELAVKEKPIEYKVREELKERITKPCARLSNQDRQILLLRMENYSYAEIAKILKVSKKRVDNRLTRLKAMYLKKD